jgi:MoaA/NifB/PqqE/SkfB family radical SAM enzyme
MIEKIFQKLNWQRKRKPFSAWQIELTTRCPLLCKMCIRTENQGWQYQDMPLENFKKILPYMKDVETIVLEGWGESLLHKDLLECIRLVKREGPQVGFVTSGKELTKNRVSELIEAGIDFIGFSIAGIHPETHANIRVHSNLFEILNAVRFFTEEKKRQNLSRPKMHLVFLMLKDNIFEVPKIPFLAKEIEVEEIILTNICHTVHFWQEKQSVFVWGSVENEYEKIVKQAEINARKLNIRIKRPSLSAGDVPLCEENPLRNLYISVDGEVSPCVYLFPPLPSPFKRIFCNNEYWVEKLSFGNIFRESFSEIWNKSNYIYFRDCFQQRIERYKEFTSALWNPHPMKNMKEFKLPEPPKSCQTCHKILGF